jgi:hypothetical protein
MLIGLPVSSHTILNPDVAVHTTLHRIIRGSVYPEYLVYTDMIGSPWNDDKLFTGIVFTIVRINLSMRAKHH